MKNQGGNFLELFIWIKSTSILFPWSALDVSVIVSEEEWMCVKCVVDLFLNFGEKSRKKLEKKPKIIMCQISRRKFSASKKILRHAHFHNS